MLPAKAFTSPNVAAKVFTFPHVAYKHKNKSLQIMHKIKFTFINMARENIYVSSNNTNQYINISICGPPKPARLQSWH